MVEWQYRVCFDTIRKRRENFDEAIRILTRKAQLDRREFIGVARDVIELMWWNLENFAPDADAPPRSAKVHGLLGDTKNACRTMQRQAIELSEFLAVWGSVALPSPIQNSGLRDRIFEAGIYGADRDPDLNRSSLFRHLVALEQLCQGLEKQIPRDRGGAGHSLLGRYGNAKARLTRGAAELFMTYRPRAQLTSTVGGPYYALCSQLYELATGQSAEEPGVGLKRYVEFAAPRAKRLRAMNDQRMRLMFGRRPNAPHDWRPREIGRLEGEIARLQTELERGPSAQRAGPKDQ